MTRRRKRIVIAAVAVGAALILGWSGLQVWLWRSPLVVLGGDAPGGELFDPGTPVGLAFMNVQACGEQQKDLYGCIVAFKDKYDRLPEDMDDLIEGVSQTRAFDYCPGGLSPYVVHFENFGKPHAVLIEELHDKHRTALKLWLRGIEPQVKTFGDGTIHLFKDGKLAKIHADRAN